MTRPSLRRIWSAACICAAVVVAVVGSLLISGHAAIVVTHGVSMNPLYYQGDLVVVAHGSSYEVGDIVAYRLPSSKVVVLHRIIGGDASGFHIKGDNNESVDPTTPTSDEIVGRAIAHVPQGGAWFRRLTSPPVLSLITFGLLLSGGTATLKKRRPHRRRAIVSRHITAASTSAIREFPIVAKVAGASAVACGILAISIGVPAWSGPLEQRTAPRIRETERMEFSYAARVESSPAYDGTLVSPPDPIFRRVVDDIDLSYSYLGAPGSLALTAELSTGGGWHSTMPLVPNTSFTGSRYEGSVPLDLKAVEGRAAAAAAVTGIPVGTVSIRVTAHVQGAQHTGFMPAIEFALTPLQLALVTKPEDLVVTRESGSASQAPSQRMVGLYRWHVAAVTARAVSIVALIMAMLAGALMAVSLRGRSDVSEGEFIRRRYAALLVRIQPLPSPEGRPITTVDTFATLARLAERYGLLILHWAENDKETFIVRDENATYRYETPATGAVPGAEPVPRRAVGRG